MLTCPMCKKKLRGLERECLNCRTDVSLLVDYVENLREGLAQAEALTRQGELGEAVWAYLAVLEVDPENPTARRQVGQVATAVRQFDRKAPGRRWLRQLRRRHRFRGWTYRLGRERIGWYSLVAILLLLLACFVLGYHFGYQAGRQEQGPVPASNSERPAARRGFAAVAEHSVIASGLNLAEPGPQRVDEPLTRQVHGP